MILSGGPAGHLLQCKPSNTRLCLLVSAALFLAPQYFVILIHDLHLRQSSSSLLPLVIRRSQLTIPLLDAMHHEHLACAPSGHIYPGVGNSTPTLSAPTQIASLGSRDFAAATTFSEVDYAHPQNHFRLPHAPRSLEIVYVVGLHHYGYNRLAAQDAMHCKLPHASR